MLREYPSQVVPFGETVIFRDTGPIKCKLRSNWNFGVWLGRDSQDDMHVLGTRQGIVKARSVKRTIQSERYDQQLLIQMKGRPYDIRGDKVIEEPPTVQITPGLKSSSPSAEPTASSEPAMATTPAVSSDVPEKEDTNQMDIEHQNTERRQDETVEMSPEVPATRPRGRPTVRMSVLPKDEDSQLNCSACAGKSFYHKVGCPRREEAMQLKETMKFLRQAEREEKAEAKKAKLTKVEVLQESKAIDEDMEPRHKGEDESPNKKQRVEHTVNHVTSASDVEVLATNEEKEFYIECDGTYWDEDDGEQLEPSQVKAGIEREVKQMRELDVAEERRHDEVPEGVRIWSGRWCHRKKAGGVRSRYVVRQYHTEWSEDAFCGTPGWGAIRLLLAVASLMRWKVMPGDFSTAFMHTPLLDSDEYWIEPPREVVPDTRIVWKLKKALNGLVTASKRFQQHLFRLVHDLGFECCPLLPTLLRNPITGTIMVVHVDDPMVSGPPGEAEKLFEALGKHIATRPGQPLHYTDASVYLGTRLWSTKIGFVEMPKEGYIEGIRNIAEQAGLHVRGGRGAATPGIKDKPKTKDDEEYIGTELHSTYRQIVGKVSTSYRGGQT